MVDILSSPPFYTNHVILPNSNNPVPPEIRQNPKFWPYFQGALGAIDGSHINFAAPASLRDIYRNRNHRIASLLAHLVFNFAMLSLDGKALPLMLVYGTMPLTMILWFQMEYITLQMLVFLLVMSYCFHTKVCAAILQSGDMPMFGMYFIIKGRITN